MEDLWNVKGHSQKSALASSSQSEPTKFGSLCVGHIRHICSDQCEAHIRKGSFEEVKLV